MSIKKISLRANNLNDRKKNPPRFLLTICNCIVYVSKNLNLFQHDKRSETVCYAFVAFVSALKNNIDFDSLNNR